MRVWIEINAFYIPFWFWLFHPLMRVWIEISLPRILKSVWLVSPSYEGVDWNPVNTKMYKLMTSFTLLWGCGLKCCPTMHQGYWVQFHPLMRVWIEIPISSIKLSSKAVSPSYEGVDWNTPSVSLFRYKSRFTLLWGCGLKYLVIFAWIHIIIVSPSYEGVDWNCLIEIITD